MQKNEDNIKGAEATKKHVYDLIRAKMKKTRDLLQRSDDSKEIVVNAFLAALKSSPKTKNIKYNLKKTYNCSVAEVKSASLMAEYYKEAKNNIEEGLNEIKQKNLLQDNGEKDKGKEKG